MDKKTFVARCGEILKEAKPNLIKCEYRLGKDLPPSLYATYYDTDEFVVVTCENGYEYVLDVTASSLIAIATTIFNKMEFK